MTENVRDINGGELELVVARSTASERSTAIITTILVLSLVSPVALALAGLGWRLFRHFAGW